MKLWFRLWGQVHSCSFWPGFWNKAHLYSFGPIPQLPSLGHKMGGGLGVSNLPNVPIVVAGINACREEYLPTWRNRCSMEGFLVSTVGVGSLQCRVPTNVGGHQAIVCQVIRSRVSGEAGNPLWAWKLFCECGICCWIDKSHGEPFLGLSISLL